MGGNYNNICHIIHRSVHVTIFNVFLVSAIK